MAALTADRLVDVKAFDNMQGGWIVSYPVDAAITIHKGAYVELDAAGFLEGADVTAGSTKFVGMALETVDNTSGAAGALSCRVLVGGVVEDTMATVAITDVGVRVFLADDQTVTLTALTNTPMGRIMAVIAANGAVLVKMQVPDIALGA